mmetsp:Transcript_1708/g.5012  ORF Transcript_1708/g.5012 Transcript_1708/m.5012 type:complete len:202 (-) Transcript_1708:1161-1766(-)
MQIPSRSSEVSSSTAFSRSARSLSLSCFRRSTLPKTCALSSAERRLESKKFEILQMLANVRQYTRSLSMISQSTRPRVSAEKSELRWWRRDRELWCESGDEGDTASEEPPLDNELRPAWWGDGGKDEGTASAADSMASASSSPSLSALWEMLRESAASPRGMERRDGSPRSPTGSRAAWLARSSSGNTGRSHWVTLVSGWK